jgi:hypothetical protein
MGPELFVVSLAYQPTALLSLVQRLLEQNWRRAAQIALEAVAYLAVFILVPVVWLVWQRDWRIVGASALGVRCAYHGCGPSTT